VAGDLVVVAHWDAGYRCTVPVRQFDIVVDEPPSVGGTDHGPTPTEFFLASLASCFALAVFHASKKRSIEMPDLEVKVTGKYLGPRFNHIVVEVASSLAREELESLIEPAIKYCYVSQTLKNQPKVEYVLAPPVTAPGPERPAEG
jgi:putative redox protein